MGVGAACLLTPFATLLFIAPLSAAAVAAPTFTADVAPLLATHCVTCHRPDGAAPFSLQTFEEVRPRARQVASALRRRTMPPWKPANPPGTFLGERRLTDDEIAVVQRWVARGAPEGDARGRSRFAAPPLDWQLGTPDLVLRLPSPYMLEPKGREQMRNVVFPVGLTETRYVKAWELKTTAPRVVHHATLVVDSAATARRLDAEDPAVGYEGLLPLSAQSPDGYFLGWTPGHRPSVSRSDLAWRLMPGSDLVALLHLRPIERAERVDVQVGLYFTDAPPSRVPAMIRLNRQDLDIPASDAQFVAVDRYTLPVDVELHAVQPHAHYLARRIRGVAKLPDGRTTTIIDIPQWDFHWQDAYRFREPIVLPAGAELLMEWTFDNSTANRANPTQPPRRVTYGQRSTDEMADLWLQVVPRDPAALPSLVAHLRRKLLPQHIVGYRMMIQADRDNAALHDDLALLQLEAGDLVAASAEFAETVRIRPTSAAARYNLGNVLLLRGQATDAEGHFRASLARDPTYGLAHQGLGLALRAQGRLTESRSALDAALRLLPDDADVNYNVGVVQSALGRFGPAIEAFRRALAARPHWGAAQTELAWALAVAPDPTQRSPIEALTLAEQAAAGTQLLDPHVLDVLAAAQAAVGRFDAAAATLQAALNEATRPEQASGRAAMAARLQRYQASRPFVWQPQEP